MIELQKTGFKWKSILFSILLLVVVAVGIVYIRKPQDIRNKAALSGAVLSMNPSSANKGAGSTFPVAVILNAGPYNVTGAEIHVQYNPAVLEITSFSTGKPLPVVLSQPSISPGNASVTLGAQPNTYLKGSDIVGTFTVKTLTNKPAAITFTADTMVSALEKTTNALVSSTGVSINGTEPSPMPVKCDGPDGSQCEMGMCPQPTCIAGQPCPKIACKLQTGVCSAGICRAPVQCNGSNNGSYCKRCKPCTSEVCPMVCIEEISTCQNGQCTGDTVAITPSPTPPVGCYYQKVQCVKAPCNPILVCPTPTSNSCTNARNGASCTIGACPTCLRGKACPAIACKLQSGTCQNGQCIAGSTNNWCPGPNGSSCAWDCNTCNSAGGCTKMKCPAVTGTCQNNTCIKPPATPTPTPYTQSGCYRAGCNGEICTSNPAEGVSICTAKPQFACYKSARCEKQTNGACGWTQTNELRQCLEQYTTPTPTPPVGCFYQQVQCVQAPCNAILVCPTKTPTPTITSTPTGTPTGTVSQTIEIRVRLAGVTDGSAAGAKISVKFIKVGGETLQLSSPLSLTHIGTGVYKATATLTNPLVAGARYRMKIKGEKHVSVEYCKLVGQTGPCADADYMNGTAGTTITYDFTTLPLPPGDVSPQDGKVDATDFNVIKSLMSKLCSELTAQDKLKADLDYNGCVTVKDIFLIRQTLETRYDE